MKRSPPGGSGYASRRGSVETSQGPRRKRARTGRTREGLRRARIRRAGVPFGSPCKREVRGAKNRLRRRGRKQGRDHRTERNSRTRPGVGPDRKPAGAATVTVTPKNVELLTPHGWPALLTRRRRSIAMGTSRAKAATKERSTHAGQDA